MPTTLTREALLDKGKLRYEVVSVPDVGDVGIRSVSELRQSQRDRSLYDDSGKPVDDLFEKTRAFAFIDQLMIDETTPMFSEDDMGEILSLDKAVTRPLYKAIQHFNGEDAPEKKPDRVASSDS